MRGLVFVVPYRSVIDVGDFIERQLSVEAQVCVALFESVVAIAMRTSFFISR